MGHLICSHSASGSANRIKHLGSIESNIGLLSTSQAQEFMQSSGIKQKNDRVLVQKERTGRTSSPRGISNNIAKLAQPTLEGGGRTATFG
jgi:hypothetical protein